MTATPCSSAAKPSAAAPPSRAMDGRCAAAARIAAVQALVLDDVGGGLAALDRVVVGHEHGTEGVVEAESVMSMAVTGWACSASAGHTPSAASRRLRAGRQRRGADIAWHGRRLERRAIDDGDAGRRPQRVGQRASQRQADGAAAGDNDVVALLHPSALRLSRARRQRCLTDVSGRPPLVAACHRGSLSCRQANPRHPAPSRTCSPFWTWSRWRRTCFAAAARSSAGSACSAARCWARRWWRPCARCRAERIAHSLHAYFLLPGDLTRPIIYNVERVRDGGSFTTRRVTAIQHGRAMFVMSVSFHKRRAGPRPPERHAEGAAARGPAERAELRAQHARRAAREHAQLLGARAAHRDAARRRVALFRAREARARADRLDARQRPRCPTRSRCISACWPTPRTSRCWTRP